MAKFCGNCGSEAADGAKFCGTCGTAFALAPVNDDTTVVRAAAPPVPPAVPPLPPAAAPLPPAVPPMPLPAVPPVPPLAATPPPQTAYRPPSQPIANPFAGVPITDYLRDLAALTFLIAAFFKPWFFAEDSGSGSDVGSFGSPFHHPWWVVIAIILSILSVAVPYVVTSRGIAGLTREVGVRVKFALNAPLLVSAVAEVIVDVAHGKDGGASHHLIGSGVAVAVAGAIFAALPRQSDEDPAHRDDARWWALTRGVLIAAVVLGLLTVIASLVIGFTTTITTGYDDNTGNAITGHPSFRDVMLSPLAEALVRIAVLLVLPLAVLLGRRAAGARVLGAVGIGIAALLVLSKVSGDEVGLFAGPPEILDSWRAWGGLVLVATAAGALALSRPVGRITAPASAAQGWVDTARLALIVAAAAGLGTAVVLALHMVAGHRHPDVLIAAAVLYAFAGAGSVASVAALGAPQPNRIVVATLACAATVLAIVAGSVAHGDHPHYPIGATPFVGLWILPILAAAALTLPASMSKAYGPLAAPKAPVKYQIGDVVNGHRFDGVQWLPIAPPAGPPAAVTPPRPFRND